MLRTAELQEGHVSMLLGASGYEHPDINSGPDADWLLGRFELRIERGLRVATDLDISWRTEELEVFADELNEVVQRVRPVAELRHLEEQISLRIGASENAAVLSGYVQDGIYTRLEFRNIEVSREALRPAAEGLSALVRAFPVRSSLNAEDP